MNTLVDSILCAISSGHKFRKYLDGDGAEEFYDMFLRYLGATNRKREYKDNGFVNFPHFISFLESGRVGFDKTDISNITDGTYLEEFVEWSGENYLASGIPTDRVSPIVVSYANYYWQVKMSELEDISSVSEYILHGDRQGKSALARQILYGDGEE